jgi:hypothetical protein
VTAYTTETKPSPCEIVATVLFALAAIAGLTPTLALVIFLDRFLSSWLDDISKYQTFVGALVFAASLALIGAALTSWNQRIAYTGQLAVKQREQDLALRLKKQQIAAALIGEIDAILSELHHERLETNRERASRYGIKRRKNRARKSPHRTSWKIFREQPRQR